MPHYTQRLIQNFSDWARGANPKGGNLLFGQNSPKLHESEENWTGGVYKILLCRSATDTSPSKIKCKLSWNELCCTHPIDSGAVWFLMEEVLGVADVDDLGAVRRRNVRLAHRDVGVLSRTLCRLLPLGDRCAPSRHLEEICLHLHHLWESM